MQEEEETLEDHIRDLRDLTTRVASSNQDKASTRIEDINNKIDLTIPKEVHTVVPLIRWPSKFKPDIMLSKESYNIPWDSQELCPRLTLVRQLNSMARLGLR